MPTRFRKLNDGWNAQPNDPAEAVSVAGDTVALEFDLNPYAYVGFAKGERGRLTFTGCTRYRLGATNDEGWFRGQCRFSRIAPAWGEFYEVTGDLLDERISDWTPVPSQAPGPRRRFLFYLRDDTFEVDARDWRFERIAPGAR